MKKLSILFMALLASFVMMSCGGSDSSSSSTESPKHNKLKINKNKKSNAESSNSNKGNNNSSGDIVAEFESAYEKLENGEHKPMVAWADKWANDPNLDPESMAYVTTGYIYALYTMTPEDMSEEDLLNDEALGTEICQVEMNLAAAHSKFKSVDGYQDYLQELLGEEDIQMIDGMTEQYANYSTSNTCDAGGNNGGNNRGNNGGGSVIECTDGMFSSIRPGKPYIIDYNATWCGPCQQLRPILESLQNSYGSAIQIYSVDIEQCPNAANSRGIENLPTLEFYDANGRLIKKTEGFLQENQIRSILSQAGVR